MKKGVLGRVLSPSRSGVDPPKSPLKRGTLTEFSPLFKGGIGGELRGNKTDPRPGFGRILMAGILFVYISRFIFQQNPLSHDSTNSFF